MSRLDELMPAYDARERHELKVAATPHDAVAAALALPVAADGLVRLLFRLRGVPSGGTMHGALRAIGFSQLVSENDCVVLGAAGRPWSPRGGLVAFEKAGPGQVRILLEVSASPRGEGSLLVTETRVAALDEGARRAFRRYWLAVGPFSALIRRRWLAAVKRALQ